MSTSRAARKAPEGSLVQQLLSERRELKVANERLRLEVRELQDRIGRPDPRLQRLEDENRRLRTELGAARNERDELRGAVQGVLEELKKASRPARGL